jgi:hypothetical protein
LIVNPIKNLSKPKSVLNTSSLSIANTTSRSFSSSLHANEETGRALRLHRSRHHSHSLRTLSPAAGHQGPALASSSIGSRYQLELDRSSIGHPNANANPNLNRPKYRSPHHHSLRTLSPVGPALRSNSGGSRHQMLDPAHSNAKLHGGTTDQQHQHHQTFTR